MTVYTEISDTAVAAFCDRYDIGAFVGCQGIAEGITNSNYLLDTARGRFILTLYEHEGDGEALPFMLTLQKHLHEKGVACSQPVADKNGSYLGEMAGKPATIVTFIEGAWPRKIQSAHCAQLGDALANMHLAGRNFERRRANEFGFETWKNFYAECEKHPAGIDETLRRIIGDEIEFLQNRWPRGLPVGAIHGDLFPDNTLFDGAKINGIIDFAYACTDSLAYDLMIAANAWTMDREGNADREKILSLFKSYQAVRPLEPAELENLSVLGRGAALRFILLRLDLQQRHPEVARRNGKDPFEYVAKLSFHQSNDLRSFLTGENNGRAARLELKNL